MLQVVFLAKYGKRFQILANCHYVVNNVGWGEGSLGRVESYRCLLFIAKAAHFFPVLSPVNICYQDILFTFLHILWQCPQLWLYLIFHEYTHHIIGGQDHLVLSQTAKCLPIWKCVQMCYYTYITGHYTFGKVWKMKNYHFGWIMGLEVTVSWARCKAIDDCCFLAKLHISPSYCPLLTFAIRTLIFVFIHLLSSNLVSSISTPLPHGDPVYFEPI